MCQEDIRRTTGCRLAGVRSTGFRAISANSPEREVRAETGPLQDLQSVVKCNGFCGREEGHREKTTIAAIGIAEAVIQMPCRAVLRVMDVLDYELGQHNHPMTMNTRANLPKGEAFSIAVISSDVELILSILDTKSRLFRSKKTASSAQ